MWVTRWRQLQGYEHCYVQVQILKKVTCTVKIQSETSDITKTFEATAEAWVSIAIALGMEPMDKAVCKETSIIPERKGVTPTAHKPHHSQARKNNRKRPRKAKDSATKFWILPDSTSGPPSRYRSHNSTNQDPAIERIAIPQINLSLESARACKTN